jgi:hypothetical protein
MYYYYYYYGIVAEPGGRAVSDVGLRPVIVGSNPADGMAGCLS